MHSHRPGAAYPGLFTLMATMLANRFWGLAGAFFLVAWVDYHAPKHKRRA